MKFQELRTRLKNKFTVRIIAGVLVIALAGTGVGVYSVQASSSDTKKTVEEADSKADELSDDVEKALGNISISKDKLDKEESVYVISDATGKPTETIVVGHLTNKNGLDTIEDVTNVTDLENVKGEETFEQNGDKVTWKANGNEIYYNGKTTAETPVTQSVSYKLDGKDITPEELAGKSGKVTMRFDYKNNSSYTETINGKEYTVHVPFIAVSALALDDSFSNVEVTNGRVEEKAGSNVVLGYALPGLKESLDVEESKLNDVEIPEYFEVTADVKDFNLSTAMTFVINATSYASADGSVVTGDFDGVIGELTDAMSKLTDGSGQLKDGSGQLSEGLKTLQSSLGTFSKGMTTLKNGVNAYLDGADKLSGGLNKLNKNVPALKSGVTTISDSSKSISDGIAKLDQTLNNSKYFEKMVESSFDKAGTKKQVSDAISGAYTSKAVKTGVAAQVTTGLKNNPQLVATLKAGVKSIAAQQIVGTPEGKAAVEQLMAANNLDYDTAVAMVFESKMGVSLEAYAEKTVADTCATLGTSVTASVLDGASAAIAADGQLASGITSSIETAAKTSATTVASGIATQIEAKQANGYSLVSGSKALSEGTKSLKDKLPELESGIGQLVSGSNTLVKNNKKLRSGVLELANGTGKIVDGVDKLVDGSDKLDEGVSKLADGIVEFDEKGIEKLINAYDGDLKPFADRLQAIINAGADYQSFSGLADNAKGSVKFIYKINFETPKEENK